MSHTVLILADIHGNLNALKSVLKDASGEYHEIRVLGDIVGYGPDPGACLEILRERGAVMISGNHDLAACGKMNIENFNDEAQSAIELHRAILSDDQKDFLKSLPEILMRGSITMAHGNPQNPAWGYILDREMAAEVLKKAETSLTLVGHTHIPALYAYNHENGAQSIPIRYNMEMNYSGVPHLANPGSVGQSRDCDLSARYILLNPEKKKITFRRCSWKTGPVRKRMIAAGYPQSLIDRMAPGKTLNIPGFLSSSSR